MRYETKSESREVINALLIDKDAEVARNQNPSYLDLLQREEPYKQPCLYRLVPKYRLILGWDWVVRAPYATYQALYSKAKLYVRAGKGPQWVQGGANRYRHPSPKLAQVHTNLANCSESD